METFEQQIFATLEDGSQFSQPVFHASRQVWPGSGEARKMTVGSGRQLSMLLNVSSRLGAFSRILLESSAWTNSEEFCYVWNRLDTRFALSAFRLTPLGQSIEENGSSLLPTPRKEGFDAQGKDHGDLQYEVKNRLWPTPCAQEDGKSPEAHMAMKARMKGGPRHTVTSLTVAAKLLPTPRHDHSGLESHGVTHLGGSLNPRFVEELMGYPIDHTALKHSATPSSRNKPTRSSR